MKGELDVQRLAEIIIAMVAICGMFAAFLTKRFKTNELKKEVEELRKDLDTIKKRVAANRLMIKKLAQNLSNKNPLQP